MSVSVDKVIDNFSKDRQKRIRKQAHAYIREYKTLRELRKALGFTQTELAKNQGVKQVNISNFERRNDMRISTLKRYVEAMGGELEINIRIPDDNTLVRIADLSHQSK